MNTIHEERNIPDHIISGNEKTVLFKFETWAVVVDGDDCTAIEQMKAFLVALAKTPGHTVTVCTSHCDCEEGSGSEKGKEA